MDDIRDADDLRVHRRRLREFAEARDWEQFHTPKNLVMALAVEVAELIEPLQWLGSREVEEQTATSEVRAELADEIADVAIYLIRLADVLEIDLGQAIVEKVARNEARYPADAVRGKARWDEPAR